MTSKKIYWIRATKEQLLLKGIKEEDIYDGDGYHRSAHMTEETAKSFIPKDTLYCYDENGVCPFSDILRDFPPQSNGHCHFLQTGDWHSNGVGLLWDQCKECGINID